MTNINKYGLLNALLNIINNYEEDSSKVVIAKYLLNNFSHIDQINIYDAAEACAVSRASIRRFSQELGFENFKNLKQDKLGYEFYTEEGFSEYEESMVKQMNRMVAQCNINLKNIKTDLAYEMMAADEIVFLVSDIYTSRCLEFQKEMILLGKMVRILSHNFDDHKLFERLSENTLIIVISTSGKFLSEVDNLVGKLPGTKVIFTATEVHDVNPIFTYIIPVGNHSIPKTKSVYHTFAIEYCLDILVNEYKLIAHNQ